MPRHKIYDECEMPRGVVHIAKAICADYDRRAKALRDENLDEAVKDTYVRMNQWVDDALATIEEEGVRREILRDMTLRRGYEKSGVQMFVSENSYYRRRRQVIFRVAQAASLIR